MFNLHATMFIQIFHHRPVWVSTGKADFRVTSKRSWQNYSNYCCQQTSPNCNLQPVLTILYYWVSYFNVQNDIQNKKKARVVQCTLVLGTGPHEMLLQLRWAYNVTWVCSKYLVKRIRHSGTGMQNMSNQMVWDQGKFQPTRRNL